MNKANHQEHSIILQKSSQFRRLPPRSLLVEWVLQVLPPSKRDYEVVIKIVNLQEIARLNRIFRKQNRPTNILSFPFLATPFRAKILGDLAICAPLLEQEAKEQCKPLRAHWAHLVVHGVLHLLGYDHHNREEASRMEKMELKHLRQLGFPNPYG